MTTWHSEEQFKYLIFIFTEKIISTPLFILKGYTIFVSWHPHCYLLFHCLSIN